jgi:ornithine cyclodeaminase
MARPGARTMALIGNGAQAEFQALAFHALLGIREIRAYDVDPGATAKLRRNLAASRDLAVVPMASIAEAVHGADIVTTVTADKTRAMIIQPGMLGAGVHVNAVGGDCPGKTELHPDIVRGARVVVEYAPQTRIEGEIQQMPKDFPVIELWELLAGRAPGRTNADQITLFDSVGFALEDYSALRWLHTAATARHAGRYIELVATPPDARDLYGWMMEAGRGQAAGPEERPAPPVPRATCPTA